MWEKVKKHIKGSERKRIEEQVLRADYSSEEDTSNLPGGLDDKAKDRRSEFSNNDTTGGAGILNQRLPRLSVHANLSLKRVYDSKKARADIVFVHGLTRNSHSTWYSKKAKVHWPSDLLKEDMPDCRTYMFGYDADIGKVDLQDGYFAVVDDAYVRGIMDGEALESADDLDYPELR
ncbi:hypothetical protein BU25DRAFT_460776 [Macroventuria anomochaeta]|uniref:Uncharacterized protein n=1 Tax=Macroventuria anomochaeta TaxID=301207 RepID=A0ACB6RVN4_9PLEO|nr:uncharacterized protein BU25DRAFT_460776 [Macroventuria anomochaeta]KAF2624952.1 hypothetical protein BU25DRAFT_460776 [Macroventuria anomochaeta]